nr:NADH dehydrogenase subunit 6 [Tropiduchidae sp. 2 WQW-2023a]
MKKMSFILLMNSMSTSLMKHPISMGTMVIIQTMMISMTMVMDSKKSWFSYILFITIIGGMMIMFMYMSSIASNEKFSLKMSKLLLFSTMLMFMIWLITNMKLNDQTMESLIKMKEIKQISHENEDLKALSKFFNLKKMNITMFMMITLMLTMVVVSNISNSFEGPLKKTYV